MPRPCVEVGGGGGGLLEPDEVVGAGELSRGMAARDSPLDAKAALNSSIARSGKGGVVPGAGVVSSAPAVEKVVTADVPVLVQDVLPVGLGQLLHRRLRMRGWLL